MIDPELRQKLTTEVLPRLGKRPRTVLEILLRDGEVSTYTLGNLGYDQPPRAAQDLKEAGVKLIKRNGVHPETGSRMAIYEIDPNQTVSYQEGRTAFPKTFVAEVSAIYNSRCNISGAKLRSNEYQVDHRVPFIVRSDDGELRLKDFQLLSASSQYTHVAGQLERRIEIAFQGEETSIYDRLEKAAKIERLRMNEYIKKLLR
jgi:hypothetical protein